MGSHSVTWHPTQVSTPRLNPTHTGWYSIYTPQKDGRLSWPRWLIMRWPGVEPVTLGSRVRHANHYTTKPVLKATSSRADGRGWAFTTEDRRTAQIILVLIWTAAIREYMQTHVNYNQHSDTRPESQAYLSLKGCIVQCPVGRNITPCMKSINQSINHQSFYCNKWLKRSRK